MDSEKNRMIFESDFINEDSMRYYVIQHVKREVCDVIKFWKKTLYLLV